MPGNECARFYCPCLMPTCVNLARISSIQHATRLCCTRSAVAWTAAGKSIIPSFYVGMCTNFHAVCFPQWNSSAQRVLKEPTPTFLPSETALSETNSSKHCTNFAKHKSARPAALAVATSNPAIQQLIDKCLKTGPYHPYEQSQLDQPHHNRTTPLPPLHHHHNKTTTTTTTTTTANMIMTIIIMKNNN